MVRKVFISFLGTNNYVETYYELEGKKTPHSVRFVQEALIGFIIDNSWTIDDRIFIFYTKESKDKNWEDNGQKQATSEIEKEGLKGRLESKNLLPKIEPVFIPEGFSEDEIWQIFNTIYRKLEQGDEIYFDVTHAFRSIPMFSTVLFNYASFLKNTKIKSIHYGAFEKLGFASEVKKMPLENRVAPVLNLTNLVKLQNWTSAANEFINFGSAKRLQEMTMDEIKPILIKTKGRDEMSSQLKNSLGNINNLAANIKTNRGIEIIGGSSNFGNIKQQLIAPLTPILDIIENDVQDFKQNDVQNMFVSVKWCIDKNLVQEGFTLLQEGIIALFLPNDYAAENKRNFVSGYLSRYKNNDFDDSKYDLSDDEKETLKKDLKSNCKLPELANIFSQISDIRNDINHAGFRQNPMSATKFSEKLIELHKETEIILNHSNITV
ncbi:MAG: TIGR02221 family CRISPR-associated protein [Bacteroidales bacterium]|jgi:CRISPR-associated Csx2 family protein|nr:TIGR02221 family CRISPR-associated protein [Bacteroidales bacterium]